MDIWFFAVPPVFGFVIGYITNALAIRMLFRPHREVRLAGLRFQGMVPRRKRQIAATVSRTVVGELLREESLARRLAGADVRQALVALFGDLAGRYLERAYGSLRTELSAEQCRAVERGLAVGMEEVALRVQDWLCTPRGADLAESLLQAVLDQSPAQFLDDGAEPLLAAVRSQAAAILSGPDVDDQIAVLLGRLLVVLASGERRVLDLLPRELLQELRSVARQAVPVLLRRFEEALLAPPNVAKLKRAVRAGIRDYLLETEGGFTKNLVRQVAMFGQDRIFREADEIVDANLHRLGELVHAEENRERLAAGLVATLEGLLARTPGELLATVPPASLDPLRSRLAAWTAGYLRRPDVRAALERFLDREVRQLAATPLRDLLRRSAAAPLPERRWAEQLACWVGGGALERFVRRERQAIADLALDTPLGRPGRYLDAALVEELSTVAAKRLVPLLVAKVPELLAAMDIAGVIEGEILAFSPQEVERVILSVAHRELRAITWWGGVLGAAVGSLQMLLHALLL